MVWNEDIKKEYKEDRKQQNLAKMKSYNVKQLYEWELVAICCHVLLFERMESTKFLYPAYHSNQYYLVWGFIDLYWFPLFYLAARGLCLPHIMWKRTDSGISEFKLIKLLYTYKMLIMLGLSVRCNLGIFPHHIELNLENPFTFQRIS